MNQNDRPKIEFLYSAGCQGYHAAIDELSAAMVETGLQPRFTVVYVRDENEAQSFRFFGSPTVRIDGEDVEEKAVKVTRFGTNVCRPYFFNGKAFDYPPKELIVAA